MLMDRNTPCKLIEDSALNEYIKQLEERHVYIESRKKAVLRNFVNWHDDFGLHRIQDGQWRFREWLPNATNVWLVGTFNNWHLEDAFKLSRKADGVWEGVFPKTALKHGDLYGMQVTWEGGGGYRLPSCAERVVRSQTSYSEYGVAFNAQVWEPEHPYVWRNERPAYATPLIYETHVGMATDEARIGSFAEFTRDVLPRIVAGGYNTVQIMGVQQHPFYASFGYHVSNFFAVCDLFGTPEDFKELVDTAHGMGLRVIMDLVHSHAVKNETEGLGCQDGTEWLYFHAGPRGRHPAWDSRCFDYKKDEVCRFLLSNCKYWLTEYHIDGFRFDGVTSMMYLDHGLNRTFNGYEDYFSANVDLDGLAYLALANEVVHQVRPDAWTLAEDVSGMPGLGAPYPEGGYGFDFRLAMGVTDIWFKLANDIPDEDWSMSGLWHELVNRRKDERSVSYVECHDQAMVGGKSFIFTLIDADMYYGMHLGSESLVVERGVALHKMSRLLTLATSGHGYLNFMGNEFGHPEWIDFPREANDWSYAHAKREWALRDDPNLRFKGLADFDVAMLSLIRSTQGFHEHIAQSIENNDTLKIITFERAGLYFAFNFHPSQAQPAYPVKVLPGTYRHVLDTDNTAFGGHGLIGENWNVTAKPCRKKDCEDWYITVNLPPRTGLVLKRLD